MLHSIFKQLKLSFEIEIDPKSNERTALVPIPHCIKNLDWLCLRPRQAKKTMIDLLIKNVHDGITQFLTHSCIHS